MASVKDIMELLRDLGIVQNIEKASRTADSLKEVSINLRRLATDLNNSEVVKEITGAAKAFKIGASALNSQQGAETILAVREMIVSVKMLVDEVSSILSSSNKSAGITSTTRKTITHAAKVYRNLSE